MTLQDTPRSGVGVDVLVLTMRASAGALAGAIAIDAVLILLPLIAGIVLVTGGLPMVGGWLLTLGVLVLGASVIGLAHTGRTAGSTAAGIRTVSAISASPAGARLVPDAFAGRLRSLSLRNGRDPLTAALAPFEFPTRGAGAPWQTAARTPLRRPALLELDSGQKLALESALVIGRSPEAPLDAPASVYVWPDMSRTLSKSHARLEWDGARAWVTDLNSTNGTDIRSGGALQSLIPYQRTPLPGTTELALGDRVLRVVIPS